MTTKFRVIQMGLDAKGFEAQGASSPLLFVAWINKRLLNMTERENPKGPAHLNLN